MWIENNDNNLEIKINAITNLKNSINKTEYSLFQNLESWWETLQDFVNKFDDIYTLSVSPFSIESYKDYPEIYKILQRFLHTAENRPLNIMFFKYKTLTPEQKQAAQDFIKKTYWDRAQLDESEYWYIVWYYKWSLWRTMQYYIDEIKKIYPVKTLVK